MAKKRKGKVKGGDADQPRPSRYRDEIAAPSVGPGPTQLTQGIAPSSSQAGEEVDRPQYGNVIRPSLDHDEGKGEDDVRPNSDDVLRP